MNEEIFITVALDRYEALLVKAEHYDNIVESAMDNAKLGWRDELELDTATIEKYILIVEAARFVGVKRRLVVERNIRLEQEVKEAQS